MLKINEYLQNTKAVQFSERFCHALDLMSRESSLKTSHEKQIKKLIKLGINRKLINSWLNGLSTPDNEYLQMLALNLHVSKKWLESGIGEPIDQFHKLSKKLSLPLVNYDYLDNFSPAMLKNWAGPRCAIFTSCSKSCYVMYLDKDLHPNAIVATWGTYYIVDPHVTPKENNYVVVQFENSSLPEICIYALDEEGEPLLYTITNKVKELEGKILGVIVEAHTRFPDYP